MATILNGIANLFRPVTAVTGVMAQPNPGAGAGVPSSGTSLPTAEPVAANPMDAFTPLWQTDPNAATVVDPLTTPLFNTDPAKIQEAASKINFTSGVSPDLLAKAMSGQDPAAFMQVLNSVAQRTLATSTQLNAATTEQAAARNNERILQALPGRVKQIQLDSLAPENQALSHPASQPLLQMVRSQIQMKNPGLSPQEINKQSEAFLLGFAGQLTAPAQSETSSSTQAGGTDWEAWAST